MTAIATVKPSDIARLKLIVSDQFDGSATVTSAPMPFYTSNSVDNPLAQVVKIRTRKLELMTPERALGNVTDEVLDMLCRSYVTSKKASPEMKLLMKSKEITDRKEGFILFVVQQSNILIAATNANLSTPPKRHVKNPGSASRRSKVKKVPLAVVKTDKKGKKIGTKPSSKK